VRLTIKEQILECLRLRPLFHDVGIAPPLPRTLSERLPLFRSVTRRIHLRQKAEKLIERQFRLKPPEHNPLNDNRHVSRTDSGESKVERRVNERIPRRRYVDGHLNSRQRRDVGRQRRLTPEKHTSTGVVGEGRPFVR